MNNFTIYDAEYWTNRYMETYSNPRARERLSKEVGAEWGDSVLTKTMEHWKKLVDQPTRPCGDKCTIHPCPCGHPERHCKGCSGASPEDQAASKAAGEGSIPSAPAIMQAHERLVRHALALLGWPGEINFVAVHYKSGAVSTTDGAYSSHMPANFKFKIVRPEVHEHNTAAAYEACSVCRPVQKMDHLPEGSH